MRLSSAALIVTITIGFASIAEAQGWSGTVINVSAPAPTNGLVSPRLAVEPNGNALAIFDGGGVKVARYIAASDSWETPIELAGPGSFFSDVALDAAGNAFVTVSSGAHLHVIRYSPSSGSTNTTTLSSNTSGGGAVVTDAAGNAMVVWAEPTGTHAARYDNASATWAAPVRISAEVAGYLRLGDRRPQ